MAGIGDQVKKTFLKTLAALGTSASNMASNAHTKLNEINLETRRRELFSEVPNCVMELWQKGVELPDPLGKMMQELGEIDEQLTVLRAQRYANVEEAKKPDEAAEAEAAATEEAALEDAAAETDAPDAEVMSEAEDAGVVEASESVADDVSEEAANEVSEESDESESMEAFDAEPAYAAEDDEAESEPEQPAEGEAPLNDTPVVEDPIDEGETGDNA